MNCHAGGEAWLARCCRGGTNELVTLLAPAAKLVVEVDRGIHAVRRTRDARRDRAFARLDCGVLQVDAELVHRDVAEAVARVAAALCNMV